MSWTQSWRAVGHLAERPYIKLVEAIDGSGRKAVVRTPKRADSNDFSTRNNDKRGVRSEIAALTLLNAAGVSVPQLHEYQAEGNWPFAVVEFIEGEALAARLLFGVSLKADEANRIAAELRSVVEAAHSLNIYHRDLHPSNVMLRTDGRAVVVDWAMAEIGEEHRDLAASDEESLQKMLARLVSKGS